MTKETFFSFSFLFLAQQNSEQGLLELAEEKVIHSILLWLITFFASLQLAPKALSVQKYSCSPGDILVKGRLCKRAESDSKTGKLLPVGSRAETTNISTKCQNSYAKEEVAQNKDSARS